jgi:hypothetical protein
MAKTNLKLASDVCKPTVFDLPFVAERKPTKNDPTPVDFWKIEETGSWNQDCQIGKRAAVAAARYMLDRGYSPLLGSIVQSMIQKGRFGGVEVGFLEYFGEHAMRSASSEIR